MAARGKTIDWRLALVVVSECHSAVEPFWHGIDPRHPLHVLPSAKAAMTGLQNVYSAIDELIGGLAADCPDAMLVLFAPHGMGPNHADVAAMALLPELLYRVAFGENFMRSIRWASTLPDGRHYWRRTPTGSGQWKRRFPNRRERTLARIEC